jgi:hypothetical protein
LAAAFTDYALDAVGDSGSHHGGSGYGLDCVDAATGVVVSNGWHLSDLLP